MSMNYIVTYYNGENLIKQFDFKQDLNKAYKFIKENKSTEAVKGISMAIFYGIINDAYSCDTMA